MLTIEHAKQILDILTSPEYGITGYEVNDDGEGQPKGERYWGDVFVKGMSAEVATMSDSEQKVHSDLAFSAMKIAAWPVPR